MTLKKATDTSFVCTLTPFLLQRQLSLLTVTSMSSRDPAWYQDQVPLADKTLVDQDLCHLPQLGETLLVSVEPTGGRLLTSLPLQKVSGWKTKCQFVEQPQFIPPVEEKGELLSMRDNRWLRGKLCHPLAVEETHHAEQHHHRAVKGQVVHVLHQHLRRVKDERITSKESFSPCNDLRSRSHNTRDLQRRRHSWLSTTHPRSPCRPPEPPGTSPGRPRTASAGLEGYV